jgi:hypothetical protein
MRKYVRSYPQASITRCAYKRRTRHFEAVLSAAEAALAGTARQPLHRALIAVQRANAELPMGHRSSHGHPSWREKFKDAAKALAQKIATSERQ